MPAMVSYIKSEVNKKIVLLDLDKTMIYYSKKDNELTIRPFLK
jgi:predicted HAD superfamily phosphohydrolase YqeG